MSLYFATFPDSIIAVRSSLNKDPPFGQGIGSIHIEKAMCSGTETRLVDCMREVTEDCTHSEDAGVRCEYNGDTYYYTYIEAIVT